MLLLPLQFGVYPDGADSGFTVTLKTTYLPGLCFPWKGDFAFLCGRNDKGMKNTRLGCDWVGMELCLWVYF